MIHLIKHTGAHTGGVGKVSMQPVFPSETWGSQEAWRWRVIRTLAHELLHVLAHPRFKDTATDEVLKIRNSQIITEGFVDLLTADVYTELCNEAKAKPVAAKLFEGLGDPGEPDATLLGIGYGDAGKAADAIRGLVSDDNVRAAFFLGATHLIGLDRSM